MRRPLEFMVIIASGLHFRDFTNDLKISLVDGLGYLPYLMALEFMVIISCSLNFRSLSINLKSSFVLDVFCVIFKIVDKV